jgi:hypothetical protein
MSASACELLSALCHEKFEMLRKKTCIASQAGLTYCPVMLAFRGMESGSGVVAKEDFHGQALRDLLQGLVSPPS